MSVQELSAHVLAAAESEATVGQALSEVGDSADVAFGALYRASEIARAAEIAPPEARLVILADIPPVLSKAKNEAERVSEGVNTIRNTVDETAAEIRKHIGESELSIAIGTVALVGAQETNLTTIAGMAEEGRSVVQPLTAETSSAAFVDASRHFSTLRYEVGEQVSIAMAVSTGLYGYTDEIDSY